MLILGTAGAAPAPVAAYTYGPWSAYSYRTVSSTECARMSATTNGRQNLWPGCRVATRFRKALTVNGDVWDQGVTQSQSTGPFSIYGVKAEARYRWNGKQVFTGGMVTCSAWGVGFVIKVDWCGTENDGGAGFGYLRYGATYNVSFVWSGSPVHATHWFRERVYVDGMVCCVTGA